METLVSVVVPVYNVEAYLEECVDSIVTQTYRNTEILLVDDGSTDRSGEMCDRLAEKDQRIRVIHKTNGGLSDARNTGIRNSKGEYIVCVDSDDIMKNTQIEVLMGLAQKYDADFVYAGREKFNEDSKPFQDQQTPSTCCLSVEEALEWLLYQNNFMTGANGKLYKRELFDGVEYPIGLFYEDLATTYRLIANSNKVAYTTEMLYGYRVRSGSIMHQGFSEKKMSCIPVTQQLYADISRDYPALQIAAASRAFSLNRGIYLQMPREKKDERNAIWAELKKYRKMVLHDGKARKRERLMAFTTYLGQGIFGLFAIPYRKQQMSLKG